MMNLYTFKLESFHISNTRSRHDDTDTVTFGLQVGNQQFPVQSYFAGDLKNGDYPVNLAFGPILIADDAGAAVFTYEIYNGDAGALPKSLVKLNQALLIAKRRLVRGRNLLQKSRPGPHRAA
jgi:hypothetical protein